MQRYETLLLTVPTITQDEIKQLESECEKVVKKGGAVISFDKWGKYRLAYPVKKNDYGVYFLARFEADKAKALSIVDGLKDLFTVKLNDIVMRAMTSSLDPKTSLEYTRPQSVEETPERETEDELSKSKIEKILSKTESRRKPQSRTVSAPQPKSEPIQAEEDTLQKDQVSK